VTGRRGRALPIAAAMAAATACAPAPPAGSGAPVLIVTVDTLRADAVGAYGANGRTPAIDAFFAAGTRFENAVSPAPCTVPAVARLLTGRFEWRRARATLAERLRAARYRTGAVVSQHHFRGDDAAVYARGFDDFDVQPAEARDHHGLSTRDAREVTDRALAWLDARPPGSPWLLWLHYFDPHDPYEPPGAYRPPPGRSPRDGDRRTHLLRERRPNEPWTRAGHIYSPDDVRHLRGLYRGEVAYTDAQVGRVLERLAERGEVERALVVLTADHGEQLGEGGRWDHCTSLLEEEIRVPLLARAAGGELGAPVRREAVSTLDVVPTVLAWLGLPPADGAEGRDLATAVDASRTVLSLWSPAASVRDAHWKLVENARARRLHPVRPVPPYDRQDHAAREVDATARLSAALADAAALRERLSDEEAALRERLRAIGYAE